MTAHACAVKGCPEAGVRVLGGQHWCREHWLDVLWHGRNPARVPRGHC